MNKYYGLDGDGIGKKIDYFIISNNDESLTEFSNKITSAIKNITSTILNNSGEIIMSGGDNIIFYGNFDKPQLMELIDRFRKETNATASIGIGNTISDAYLGLKIAKSSGGNQICNYNEMIRK